jgi:hypothetical protein
VVPGLGGVLEDQTVGLREQLDGVEPLERGAGDEVLQLLPVADVMPLEVELEGAARDVGGEGVMRIGEFGALGSHEEASCGSVGGTVPSRS